MSVILKGPPFGSPMARINGRWQFFDRGIITDVRTLIPFSSVINLIVKSAEKECKHLTTN